MGMIEIFVQSCYSVNRDFLRKHTIGFMKKLGIDPVLYTVSIAIVGDRKMKDVHERFAKKSGTTPVLSFALAGGRPLIAPHIDRKYRNDVNAIGKEQHLIGEIIISYPQTLIFASDEN